MAASTGGRRNVHKTERRRDERDAVCNGKCRHGDGDTPPVPNQDHQRQNEQKMIEAEQDVFDAKAQISCSDFSRRLA